MFELKKEPGKAFTILNLADIQLSDTEWETDNKNLRIAKYTIDTLVKKVSPDLITLSGDQSCAGQYDAYIKLGQLIDSYNIPWTFVWGNHDQQDGYEFTDKVIDAYSSLNNLLFEKGPDNLGQGNFVIKITENCVPKCALILMDTHDRHPYISDGGEEKLAWAKLYPEQFTWYEEQINMLNTLGFKETVIISHIPIFAYKTAADLAFKSDVKRKKITFMQSLGNDIWNDAYSDSFGVQYENISCYPLDDGFFDLIKKLSSTKNIICGHDHINCTSICLEGVRLTFALKTGPGCYWKPELNGGTVITISDDGVSIPQHEFVDVSDLHN